MDKSLDHLPTLKAMVRLWCLIGGFCLDGTSRGNSRRGLGGSCPLEYAPLDGKSTPGPADDLRVADDTRPLELGSSQPR